MVRINSSRPTFATTKTHLLISLANLLSGISGLWQSKFFLLDMNVCTFTNTSMGKLPRAYYLHTYMITSCPFIHYTDLCTYMSISFEKTSCEIEDSQKGLPELPLAKNAIIFLQKPALYDKLLQQKQVSKVQYPNKSFLCDAIYKICM